jgi:hypothetical protein
MRRTPLVAGGFLAGALIGALPPMQVLTPRWTCVAEGGRWHAEVPACEYRRTHFERAPAHRGDDAPELLDLRDENDR